MSVACICALIGIAFHLPGDEPSVGTGIGGDMVADRVTHTVAHEGLLAADVEFDESATDLLAAETAERLIERILLVAESAADVWLDQAHAAPRQAKRLPADAAHDMRNLRARDDHQLAKLFLGIANVVFNMAMLDDWRIIPAFDFHETGFLNRFFKIADFIARVREDVVFKTVMQLRGAVLHRFLHIQHKGELFIFHLERADTLIRRNLILRDDHGDIVAVIAHVAIQKQPVRNVLMVRVGRPRMPGRGEGQIWHIKAGQHLDHAGNFFGGAGVDRLDHAVGDG
ncbi:hypothetical protein SDC9_121411 [bioreactor metagenome]|uniref:Uncharacterized protein n=1 Tax=bioreactor metagenome TaxID=1076179 RepID=A0A645CBX2_9ZZZZ